MSLHVVTPHCVLQCGGAGLLQCSAPCACLLVRECASGPTMPALLALGARPVTRQQVTVYL